MLKLEDLVVDPEFEALLPELSPEEFKNLEQSILKNAYLILLKCGKNQIQEDTSLLMDITDIGF